MAWWETKEQSRRSAGDRKRKLEYIDIIGKSRGARYRITGLLAFDQHLPVERSADGGLSRFHAFTDSRVHAGDEDERIRDGKGVERS